MITFLPWFVVAIQLAERTVFGIESGIDVDEMRPMIEIGLHWTVAQALTHTVPSPFAS